MTESQENAVDTNCCILCAFVYDCGKLVSENYITYANARRELSNFAMLSLQHNLIDKKCFRFFFLSEYRTLKQIKIVSKQTRIIEDFIHRISQYAATCQPIKKAPAATTLQCSPTACNATCAAKFKFQHGETVLTTECVNSKWVIKNPKYKNLKELPGCQRKTGVFKLSRSLYSLSFSCLRASLSEQRQMYRTEQMSVYKRLPRTSVQGKGLSKATSNDS